MIWTGGALRPARQDAELEKYLADNHVEDVFARGGELAAFQDRQTELMLRVLREARVP